MKILKKIKKWSQQKMRKRLRILTNNKYSEKMITKSLTITNIC